MNELTFDEVFDEIKKKLDSSTNKKKVVVLYSFNGTGKTRLSNKFSELNNDKRIKYNRTLCYNAFLEDLFSWDNERCIFTFDSNSWEAKLIKDEGLQDKIAENFKEILNTQIEPSFNSDLSEITFNISSGDDTSNTNIKISRGEESTFLWVIFYTILQTAIDLLNEKEKYRSTAIFNKLKYIIIDDAVSSMDDTNIITTAIKLFETIESHKSNELKFLITTHHPLFYNVIANSCKDNRIYTKKNTFILLKNESKFKLANQDNSPFGYHLVLKNEIQKAIVSGNIQKYHFNFFRNLLEKSANFLGYTNWYYCISKKNRKKISRLVNQYSHGKLSEMESKDIGEDEKKIFIETFNDFIKEFKWKVEA